MGKIPRKLNQINGFVIFESGLIPYETKEDRALLLLWSKIYQKAIKEGRIVFEHPDRPKDSIALPLFEGASQNEQLISGSISLHVGMNAYFFKGRLDLYGFISGLAKTRNWRFAKRKYIKYKVRPPN